MAVIDMTRVAPSAEFTALYRRPLAPIAVAQGTAVSAAGFDANATGTTDGSPPREAPV